MSLKLNIPFVRGRRVVYFGLVAGTTVAGTVMMAGIVSAQGLTVLECVILALFVPTFAWIVMPFWTAVIGFGLRLSRRDPVTLAPSVSLERASSAGTLSAQAMPRTAVVIPVYNENPDLVAARAEAMIRSLRSVTSGGASIHLHLLSDTQDQVIARREEVVWVELQGRHPEVPVHYRRRERNEGRKAGNVGEFCRRCGDDYDLMVVLDADSIMTGETILHLVRLMQANPDVGLIQTIPLPALQRSLFGRLIQFAGRLYGPVLAAGQAFWYGDAANYWGHNAIMRLRPFMDHAKLPVLPGRPPLGGEVLSHDFVEGAFLRRAGWRVVLAADLPGSWEELPPNVEDYARRDRRWAQGSLQHLRLLFEPGLHPLSRLHFLLGAMGYISSLLWLLILLAGTAYVLLPVSHGPVVTTRQIVSAPVFSLLALTAIVLFVPKLLGLVAGLLHERQAFGGAIRMLASAFLETVFSILLAPVMMLYHASFVLEIVFGRSVGWDAQDRERTDLTWAEARRAGRMATVVGVVWGGLTFALSPLFFIWMSPIFLGLLLSIPLIRWTSLQRPGQRAHAAGLLLVPSETSEPSEVTLVRGAQDAPARADLLRSSGVLTPPSVASTTFSPAGRSMVNAERGLFDLRQGRPLLITDKHATRQTSTPSSGVLIAAVEGLEEAGLDRLRVLGMEPLRLVVTAHRVRAMGLSPEESNAVPSGSYSITLRHNVELDEILELACSANADHEATARMLSSSASSEAAGLSLLRLARLLPAVVAIPVWTPHAQRLDEALARGEILTVDAAEVHDYVAAADVDVVAISEAPVPLAEAVDSRFVLFREPHGLQEHVAIMVGNPADWPDPLPVRLHSACLTGDLFGSLRCDCGEQLRGSMKLFGARGGGVLLYLAQEGRGIGLRNKFRAYTLQDGGLDTIDADNTLGFGPDERRYDVAARMLQSLGLKRIELLTNNPEKMRAMEEAGITVVGRRPLHGTLNRHNRPYVEAKVNRAGHWLKDMLAQPLSGD
ncbi:MAG: glucans biosynthesis glucosyltransferase MdoH [Longimicrobiales bacterium]|nr:glucans biosynthesis glucosyltransferase MdoH [Longimicrobiales bacterium]